MTNYNDGKWHSWDGGQRPVHPKTIVQVQQRNETRIEVEGEPSEWHRTGAFWDWTHTGEHSDIIAFRVIKEHREPLQTWMKQNEYGDLVECGFDEPGATLFREVLE